MPFAFFDPPAWINAHECLVVMSIIRIQKSGLLTLISLSFFLGSVYNKMSRKDKYETNNRRQQTFMSAEDVAAGRKSSWQGVEITGEWTRRQAAQGNFHVIANSQAMFATSAHNCGNSSTSPRFIWTTTACHAYPATSGSSSICER